MRRLLALVLAAACGDVPSAEAPAPSDPPAVPPVEDLEAELLAKGPPQGRTPFAEALGQLATELGVGVVRCPLGGGGKADLRFGTPRDQVPRVGPMLLLEVDPATAPPWHPVFDVAAAEDEWLSMLAVPGATRSWAATRKRMFEFDHPPAVAGETTPCTGVRQVPFRTVRGQVDLAGATGRVYPYPCIMEPPPVGADGTFVLDVPVPCTLWVESENRVSGKVRVDPGEEPFDASFVLGPPDRFQDPEREYTEAGKAMAREHLATLTTEHDEALALVERLAAAAQDPQVKKVAEQWKYDLWAWKARMDRTRSALDTPTPPTPAEGKH